MSSPGLLLFNGIGYLKSKAIVGLDFSIKTAIKVDTVRFRICRNANPMKRWLPFAVGRIGCNHNPAGL